MSTVPEDLLVEILSRVPVKSLVRFKCVSKTWNSIISDPQFAKLQLLQAKQNNKISINRLLLSTWSPRTLNFEEFGNGNVRNLSENVSFPEIVKGPPKFSVQILGSCEGLVCLLDDFGTMFLWNPTTRDYKKLPKPDGAIYGMFLHGLGYDFSADDYGIIFASHFTDNGAQKTVVQHYTLKTNTWQRIKHFESIPKESPGVSGIFWNGSLYWLKVKPTSLNKVYVIVSFNMAEKKFEEVLSVPEHFDPSLYKASLGLSGSGNCLMVFCESKESCFEALALNLDGTKAFWSQLFHVSRCKFPGIDNTVICSTKNGEVVVKSDGWKLYLYNPKDGVFRNFEMNNDGDSCELELYVQSLVSPNVVCTI